MRLVTLLLLTILCTCVCAQTGEFTQHANGYIYPEATMNDLAYIVDSLDLKFKQCDLDREYCSPAQTMATCYEVKNKNLTTIARQLRKVAENEPFSLLKVLPDANQLRRGTG
ncbi:hypothetical protein [Neolewinella agarilytica]|uniref:Uncharacterized protein n=1 Tax=Neolewinella agarilytica TaxID=478744 RepID=A0A1H9MC58_9BACT|nr:hypothetical protein [Neolewinella agarilytica]SER21079.1 hypothetical protein SAMN05444359_12832 [Neolewinella agarilytica]